MPHRDMSQLARQLADQAEDVCRHYLPPGRREGGHWVVGNLDGAVGQSLKIRLHGSRAGKWCDYATGAHGDLIDLIAHAESCSLGAAAKIARQWFHGRARLSTKPKPQADDKTANTAKASRLWQLTEPLAGSIAEAYLQNRGLTQASRWPSLRFLPRAFCRDQDGIHHFPTLVAAVSSAQEDFMGVHRTFLDARSPIQAPVRNPKRLLGPIRHGGVRFKNAKSKVLVIGEGIETVLSILEIMPDWAGAATLSASHMATFIPDAAPYNRILIAADPDPAGRHAANNLQDRLKIRWRRVEVIAPPSPSHGDFNDILCAPGGPSRLADYISQKG